MSQGRQQPLLRAWRSLSLKSRLVVATVSLLALFMWALALLSATVLKGQIEQLLFAQQFGFTRQVAAEIDAKLRDRIDGLERVAAGLPADLSYASLYSQLRQHRLTHMMFTGGIAVIGHDGVALADYPAVPGRRGTSFADREYLRRVVATGKPYIDKPFMGRILGKPVLVMAVPVPDAAGKTRAVMTGVTDLGAPNFLQLISDPDRIGASEYFLMSIRDHMFVATSDGRRALAPAPPRGANPLFDRMLDGFEGSAVGVSSEGVEKLYSDKRIPAADWLLMVALPTTVAFAPVRAMRLTLFAIAAALTLVAVFAIGGIVRNMLAPLDSAGAAMRRMTDGEIPLAPLPDERGDEVGHLIGNFNRLVEDRRRYEHEQAAQAAHLMDLSRRLVATQEEERRRLSAALHDRTSPNLAALDIMLRTAAQSRSLAADGGMLVEDARALLDDTTASIREICADLRPPLLDYAGLLPALGTYAENFARRTGIRVNIDCDRETLRLVPGIESNLFRIAQEAMTNCAKHARANNVDISLDQRDGRVTMSIADDGIGFDIAAVGKDGRRPGLGLLTMQERVEFVGGRIDIRSHPGEGTRVTVSMPATAG
jgi:signal transduction histidine kinase